MVRPVAPLPPPPTVRLPSITATSPVPAGEPVDSSADTVLINSSAVEAQTDQVLVRLVEELAGQQFEERAAEYARALSVQSGVALRTVRRTASGSVVFDQVQAGLGRYRQSK